GYGVPPGMIPLTRGGVDARVGLTMRLDQLSTSWWVWRQVMQLLNRRADLERLLHWARRKRLPGPRTTYERQLSHTVRTLVMYKTHYPRLVRWAFRLHRLNALLTDRKSVV